MTTRNQSFWTVKPTPEPHSLLPGTPKITAQLLAQREHVDLTKVQGFLDPDQYHPTSANALPDMDMACETLDAAITDRKRILIWGDFDVDGQTATALLLDGLSALGATPLFYIPKRLTESHGVHISSLSNLIEAHEPEILLTCDTGITAHEAIDYAIHQGLKVVVTDHHDLPQDGILPPAHANLNPKRLPSGHPLRTLPGVGVAFELIEALYDHRGIDSLQLNRLLDLVALGIVADVAEQVGDTRYLLQLGLRQLQKTDRPGLQALYKTISLEPEQLSTESIGFQIAPRLNAAGRLDDATLGVHLLTTAHAEEAAVIASQLEGLNRKRRVLQRDILSAARTQLSNQPELLQHTALVLYQPGWHTGLLGIVAGQLADQYQRPCILLTSSSETPHDARGSARSASGFDIGAAIAAQAPILSTFGGHSGAAGLALPTENIDRFRRQLSATLENQEAANQPQTLTIDLKMNLPEITPALTEEIGLLAPFGEGNPPVILLCENLSLASSAILGREQLHRRITVTDNTSESRQVLWWNGMEYSLPEGSFDLAFTLGWNIYRGQREMALTLVAIKASQTAPVASPAPSALQIIDWLNRQEKVACTEFLALEPDGIIWAEGDQWQPAYIETKKRVRRHELQPDSAMLILTSPPSRAVLNRALDVTGAQRAYLVGLPVSDSNPEGFRRLLLRYLRHSMRTEPDSPLNLDRLAGTMATTIAAVEWGLRCLAAQGTIMLREHEDQLCVGSPEPSSVDDASYSLEEAHQALENELTEIAAFRSFVRRTGVQHLIE